MVMSWPLITSAACSPGNRIPSAGSRAAEPLRSRRLFTDQDEMLFAVARPVILNGIDDVVTRPDLADRAIMLTLGPIAETQRRPEKALWQEFEHAHPRILGALLDAVAYGLRTKSQVRLERLPRMGDFALWATACETAFWPSGAFERAYGQNRYAAIENVVDTDPVAACVRDLMAKRSTWAGSASDLLSAGADAHKSAAGGALSAGWPRNPRALASRLRRAKTCLRALGIEVAFNREGRLGTRMIRVTSSLGERSSAPSA